MREQQVVPHEELNPRDLRGRQTQTRGHGGRQAGTFVGVSLAEGLADVV